MKNKIKILLHLIENRDKELTIKRVSEDLKINYRIVFEEIKSLENKKIIKIRKTGNSNLCSFNYILNEITFQAEIIRKDIILKNKNIKLIDKRIKEIQYPFYIFLVFGSYARNRQTKNSDIDICIITESTETKRKIKSIIEQISLQTHLLEFTLNEFLSMIKTKEPNVGHEILKNNIILKGIEEFYELVNYVES